MKTFYTRIVFFVSALFCTAASFATDYYVDAVNGNNGNNGLTPATAFRTLARVSYTTTTLNPGDVVYIRAGTYGTTDLVNVQSSFAVLAITQSGTDGNPITFRNYPGESPLIQFNNWHGIYMQAAYIVIDGIRIRGTSSVINLSDALNQPQSCANRTGSPDPKFNGNGIWLDNSGVTVPHHVTVRNCEVWECPGVGIGGRANDYITIEANRVYANSWYTRYGASGISLLHLTDFDNDATVYRNIIRNNIVYDNELRVPWFRGSGVTGTCAGFTDGNGIIIDDANNGQSGGSGIRYTGRTLVENNVVYNNGGRGIHVFVTSNVTVVNNTTYANCKTPEIRDGEITVMSTAASLSEGNRVFNNVMFARKPKRLNSVNNQSATSSLVQNNNLMYNSDTFAVFRPRDIMAYPHFVDTAARDFRLQAISPGIDAGNDTAGRYSTTDILGAVRPFRALPDMGAYEYTGAAAVRTTFAKNNLAVLRVGSGTTYVPTQTQAVNILEYTTAGTATGINVLLSGGAVPFTVGACATTSPSGSFPSDGQLTRSRDGRYLMAVGYELAVGTDSANNWRMANKRLARLDFAGEVDTTTTMAASQFNTFLGSFVRNAASDFGASFWVSASQNFRTVNLTGTTSAFVSAAQAGRTVQRYGDSVYQINFNTIASVAGGVRREMGGTGTGNISQDFVTFDLDPTVSYGSTGWDVLYRTELDWGLRKYYYDGTTWIDAGTYSAGGTGAGLGRGFTSLTARRTTDGKPEIFGVQGTNDNNRVMSVVDNSAYNVNWQTAGGASAPTATTVVTAGAGYSFRGIAFTPTQYGISPPRSIVLLPVNLVSLQGYLVGNDALLQWRTATETNVKEYAVERSRDAVAYAAIGSVRADNNSSGSSYSYTDRNLAEGVYYYRLRTVDFDGKRSFSKVVAVKNVRTGEGIKLFPNPAVQNLTVSYPEAGVGTVLTVVNTQGQEVLRQVLPQGSRQTEVNVSGWVRGQYSVVIATADGLTVSKFIK